MFSPGYFFELMMVLTRKELSVRYKNSLLGYIWSVAHPLSFGLIYYVVFQKVMRVPVENYALFLLCGLFPWQWFSSVLGNSTNVYLSNAAIIRRVPFPRSVLPISLVLMEGVHFLCALPVIILLMSLKGVYPAVNWLWGVPLLWSIQALLLIGLAWVFAALTPFLRDIERFVALSLMAVFYATPVLYSPTMIPERWKWVVSINPAASLILAWRELLMNGKLSSHLILLAAVGAALCLLIGMAVTRFLSFRLAEVL